MCLRSQIVEPAVIAAKLWPIQAAKTNCQLSSPLTYRATHRSSNNIIIVSNSGGNDISKGRNRMKFSGRRKIVTSESVTATAVML